MQTVSADFVAQLDGSIRPSVVVDAWYDGELVAEDLPITAGSVTFDRTRSVLGSCSVTVATTRGELSPTAWGSALAPFGSELHIRAGLLDELVSLGWFRIDSCDPAETWARYTRADGSTAWVRRAVQVAVEASDRLALVDDFRMLAPEQPAQLASARTEIERLVESVVPIGELGEHIPGIADATIPRSIEYSESRLDALNALADLMGCYVGMDPDGALSLWPTVSSGPPVWSVEVAANMLSWSNAQSRDGIYNAVIASGEDPDAPVQGVAVETDGPLRWGGPFGMVPYGYASPLLTTPAMAQSAAETTLARLIRQRVVTITVATVANPALQLGDVVALVLPDRRLIGVAESITFDLPAASMTLGLTLPRVELWSVAQAYGLDLARPLAEAAMV